MNKSGYKIAFIGAGKLAWSVIPALHESGYKINFILSRKLKDAETAAVKFGIDEFSESLDDIPQKCNVIFLAVPDDQLKTLSKRVSRIFPSLKNKIFVHFSGVYSSLVLKEISQSGGLTASFHIMQTFPSRKRVTLKNTFTSVETKDKNTGDFLFQLAEDLGISAFGIDAHKKTAYHLAGVFASNFLVANFFNAEKLFGETGSSIDFLRFIDPIVKKTMSNIKKSGPGNSLSGPVERGDIGTIRMHCNHLRKNKLLLQSYIVQSLCLISIKKEQGIITPAQKNIESYLSGELKKLPKKIDQVIRQH